MKEIFTALSKAQGEFPNIKLNASVTVETVKGGSYKFDYSTMGNIIQTVKPILAKYELGTYQSIEENCMVTRITHSSGDVLVSTVPMPTLPEEPQKRGSIISYMRRYGKCLALDIVGEDDDDANIAEGNYMNKTTKDDYFVSEKTGGVRYKGEWFNNQEADLMQEAKKLGKDLDKAVEYIKSNRKS